MRPLMVPQPVTTPSPGMRFFSVPNSVPRCSTNMSNSSKLCGIEQNSMRSRAVSLPRPCWASIRASPPPALRQRPAFFQFVDDVFHGAGRLGGDGPSPSSPASRQGQPCAMHPFPPPGAGAPAASASWSRPISRPDRPRPGGTAAKASAAGLIAPSASASPRTSEPVIEASTCSAASCEIVPLRDRPAQRAPASPAAARHAVGRMVDGQPRAVAGRGPVQHGRSSLALARGQLGRRLRPGRQIRSFSPKRRMAAITASRRWPRRRRAPY